jgi:hypothetical protein
VINEIRFSAREIMLVIKYTANIITDEKVSQKDLLICEEKLTFNYSFFDWEIKELVSKTVIINNQ